MNDKVMEIIAGASKHHSVRAREVDAIIRDNFPDSNFKRMDIYNARSDLRRQQLAGYTIAGTLMVALDKGKIDYIIK